MDVYKLIGYGKKKWPSNFDFVCIRLTHLMAVDLRDLWDGPGEQEDEKEERP